MKQLYPDLYPSYNYKSDVSKNWHNKSLDSNGSWGNSLEYLFINKFHSNNLCLVHLRYMFYPSISNKILPPEILI